MKYLPLACTLLVWLGASLHAAASEIIEGRTFTHGLRLENREDVVIRQCHISNRDGTYGIHLVNCRRVRIEGCTIRRIGHEAMIESQLRSVQGYRYGPALLDHLAGILIENSSDVTIVGNDITDSCSKGIAAVADRWDQCDNLVIEDNRIAYIFDDGIDFAIRGDARTAGKAYLPIRGTIIRRNLIHDIGLGLTRLGFARHGIYLTVRDAIVEDNTVYNCFYGEGISIRNSAVVRRNLIRNCARAGIAYWAQTNTEGSSAEVRIEENDVRQEFTLPIPMRHIFDPRKLHRLPLGGIVLQFVDNPHARIERFVVRGNRIEFGADYAGAEPLIAGNADPARNEAAFEIAANTLVDHRAQPVAFRGLPARIDVSRNILSPVPPAP